MDTTVVTLPIFRDTLVSLSWFNVATDSHSCRLIRIELIPFATCNIALPLNPFNKLHHGTLSQPRQPDRHGLAQRVRVVNKDWCTHSSTILRIACTRALLGIPVFQLLNSVSEGRIIDEVVTLLRIRFHIKQLVRRKPVVG